ncbi:MAG: hypothetical protein R2838_12470 [Caldilineaceae bacterium]
MTATMAGAPPTAGHPRWPTRCCADILPTLLARAPRLLYTMRSSIDTDVPMATQLELANFVRDNSLNEIPAVGAGQPLWRGNLQRGNVDLVPDRSRVRAALDSFFSPAPQDDPTALAAPAADWVRGSAQRHRRTGHRRPHVTCCRPKAGRSSPSAMRIGATTSTRSSSTTACPTPW